MSKVLLVCIGILLAFSVFSESSSRKWVLADKTFNNNSYITNVFRGNSFVSLGGGALVYIGEFDGDVKLKERVSPALNITAGKWFTPVAGVRLNYNGGTIDNEYLDKSVNTGYLHLDVMYNLSNRIRGYKDSRRYGLIPYLGAGVMHQWSGEKCTDFAANLGVINSYSVTSRIDVQLDLMFGVVRGSFDGIEGKKLDSFVSANVGVVYRFGNRRGWKLVSEFSPLNDERFIANLDSLNNRINELKKISVVERENSALLVKEIKSVNERVELIRASICENPQIAPYALFFEKDKAELSNSERVSLDYFADLIKRSPKSVKFVISSFPETEQNSNDICHLRAKMVKDILVNEYEVDESVLTLEEAQADEGGIKNIVLIKRK